MGRFKHIRNAAFFCVQFLIFSAFWPSAGCTPAAPNGTEPQAESTLQNNFDPDDSEVAVLTGKTNGDFLVFHGTKDETGEPTGIASMSYFATPADASPMFSLQMDAGGRPAMLASAEGEQIVFEYDDANQAAIAYFRASDGTEEVLTFDLAEEHAAGKFFSRLADQNAGKEPVSQNGTPEVTRAVRIVVRLFLVPADAPNDPSITLGQARDGVVTATASNTDGFIPPGALNPDQGTYEFFVASRVANVEFLVRQCQSQVDGLNDKLLAGQVLLGIYLGACSVPSLMTKAVCSFLSAFSSTLLGVGADIASDQFLKSEKVTCEALRRTAAAGGSGIINVTVSASVPRLNWSESQTISYNLLDPNDAVTALGFATMAFNISVADCGGCPEGRLCDRGQCVGCVLASDCSGGGVCSPARECVVCLTNTHCRASGTGPICIENRCTGCTTDQECVDLNQGLACSEGACLECTTGDQCINAGRGVGCRDNRCVECIFDIDCDDAERCDPTAFECVAEEAGGGFVVRAYTNTDCTDPNFSPPGACGTGTTVDASQAQIQLSGDPRRPTIGWAGTSNVYAVVFTRSNEALYAIEGRTPPDAEGNSDQAAFSFSSVVYGDYNLPNAQPFGNIGTDASDAVDLSPGTLYSVTIYTLDISIATLTFEIAP